MTSLQAPWMNDSLAVDRPLRVSLLLDSFWVPGWVASTIEEIHASPVANIVIVLLNVCMVNY